MSAQPALRVMERLLAQQGAALRAGDLASLQGLAPALESAVARLGAQRPTAGDAPALAVLRAKAAHQASLIAAALAGVRAAHDILAVRASGGFTGYDAKGRPARIGVSGPPPRLERRS